MKKIFFGLTILSLGYCFSNQIENKQLEKVTERKFSIDKIMPCNQRALTVGDIEVNIEEVVSFVSDNNKDKVFTHELKEGYENKYSICEKKDGKYLLKVKNTTYKIKK